MTFINRLIKQAKAEPPPRELTIRPNQVSALAEHVRASNLQVPPQDIVEGIIRAGELRLLDVPIRVLGS